ncbi:MAG: PLP-dependent aminotransferase family protein [Gammaproteobacteria bacterium]|nr:PLP-dependent aminotransferase family protein [Gammaproteobacteria bacterium]
MQVRKGLTRAILEGRISMDLPLPSGRELAQQLKVSRNTIVLAYQRLVDEGYLISRERQGYFVNPAILRSTPLFQDEQEITATGTPNWQTRLNIDLSVQRNIQKPVDWQTYKYPFIYGQSDPALFPIADWRECVRQSQSVALIAAGSLDYIDQDDEVLVEELCIRVLPRRGIWIKPENLLVTIGAQNALSIISQLLFNKDTVIGIENPGYPDARNLFLLRTEQLVLLDIDENGLVINDKIDRCDYVYVTPSHQSPTTATMPLDRRKALLEKATMHDLIIIEDDYESEANYIHQANPALKSLDKDNRVIYCGSLSKSLAPGLRLGFLVADSELIQQARMLRRLLLRHPPALVQRTVALFLQLGHYDSHINRISQVLKRRWEHMCAALEQYLPDSTDIPEFGGTAFWVRGPAACDARMLAQSCAVQSILIEPGDVHFGQDQPPMNYFRLGFSSITEDRINDGISLLSKKIDRM